MRPGRSECLTRAARGREGRQIAVGGTLARVVLGALLLGLVIAGQASSGWHLPSWALGLLVFPGVLTLADHARARRTPCRLDSPGPLTHVLTVLGVKSEQLERIGEVPLPGQLYNVLQIVGARIVSVRDFAHRHDALAAAGAEAPRWR